MSIFWLLPQYALMGVTEVFLSIGQIEFFTNQMPQSMRSLGNAMACCTIALGNFGSSMLVEIVTKVTNGKWIQNDLNQSHIDYFYWLLTFLIVVNLTMYLFFARRYGSCDNPTMKGTNIWDEEVKVNIDKRIHPVHVDINL